jgi:hypothetical protein
MDKNGLILMVLGLSAFIGFSRFSASKKCFWFSWLVPAWQG